MLRVQKHRLPEDWDKRVSKLSGRFLPLDPGDETVLDVLENDSAHSVSVEDAYYGPEGPPSEEYGASMGLALSKKWSKRSEAARKRWADPAYRAMMLKKRAEKRRRDAEASGELPKQHKVEIGRMDSVTLSGDDKAKAINAYARSNKLRSEKITAFHRNRKTWMETRLSDSRFRVSDEDYVARKKKTQENRQEFARQRAIKRKQNAQRKADINAQGSLEKSPE